MRGIGWWGGGFWRVTARCGPDGLRGTGYGLRVTGYGLRVTGYGLRGTGYGVRVTGYGVRGTGYVKPAPFQLVNRNP